MSRLSSGHSVPISDRIKVFDKTGKPRTGAPPAPAPQKLSSQAASPFGPSSLTSRPGGQFSAKDPTRPNSRSSTPSKPSTPTPRTSTASSASTPTPRGSQAAINSKLPAPGSTTALPGPALSPINPVSAVVTPTATPRNKPEASVPPTQAPQPASRETGSSEKLLTNGSSGKQVQSNGRIDSREDTVDRAPVKVLEEKPSCTVRVVGDKDSAKVPRKITEEFLVNNNLPASIISSVTSHTPTNGIWSGVSRGVEGGIEEKDSKYESSTIDSEPPSFSSSVTEDVELLLPGGRRFGVAKDDLEEQVEELSQQVEMLLKVKARLEAEVASVRREQKREVADREDELEDARNSAAKKVKLLELQLEQEHEERLGFLRERHEMEGRIMSLKDALEHGHNEDQVRKLRKDLRKSKALLKDAQLLLDRQGSDGVNKLVLRQLKNQLEDSEFARTAALKARQNCELELQETQTQLEDVCRAKAELEERMVKVGRERADLALQLKENEEEMQELIKKYKASVAAGSTDQITIQDQAVTIQELEAQRNRARELLAEAEQRVEHLRGETVTVGQHRRLELRLREYESKLELEKTGKGRLETQVARLREVVERQGKETEGLRAREKAASEEAKKATKQWREAREEVSAAQGREAEAAQKRIELEKQLEVSEVEVLSARNELKLAVRRAEDLQAAIHGEMDSETDLDDTVGDSEDEDLLLQQAGRRQSKSRSGHSLYTEPSGSNVSTVSSIEEREESEA